MPTARKKHLRKKRLFLSKQTTFAILNASNLKTSKIKKVKMSLRRGKIYFTPLYLTPPKIAKGCPVLIAVYDSLTDMRKSVASLTTQMDCLALSIKKKWYSVEHLKRYNILGLEKKALALLLLKLSRLKKYN
uniref:Uncharacterized protein n=1 Tax=Sargassum confusum TaxID=74091 RepID=A0A3Q8R1K7_9PHAE|nr:hypothetical protein N4M72_mgp24 [Sargassum confusum]AZJ16115.1 hypothetical protein SarcoMp14 [Sargassum confusum]UVW81659.1 hypothetical protein [Sargassum confusum]